MIKNLIYILLGCFVLDLGAGRLVAGSASTSKSGIAEVKTDHFSVNISPRGIKSISYYKEEIIASLGYKVLDRSYHSLLDSSSDISEVEEVATEKNIVSSVQAIERNGSRIKCTQRVQFTKNGAVEILYKVEPLQLSSINVKQQRIILNLNGKNVKDNYVVFSADGTRKSSDKFSGVIKRPRSCILFDRNGKCWQLETSVLKGAASLSLQFYSSYNKFINLSLPGKKGFILKLKISPVLAGEVPLTADIKQTAYNKLLKNAEKNGVNLLTNPSFEFGMSDWITEWSYDRNFPIWKEVRRQDNSRCMMYTGKALRNVKFISRPVDTMGKRVFSVSASVCGSKDGQSVQLGIVPAPVNGQKRSKYFMWKKFKLSTGWRRYNATFVIPKSWKGKKICFMVGPDKPGTVLKIDDAAIYPGLPPGKVSDTAYFGAEFSTGRTGNIYLIGQKGLMKIKLTNLSEKDENFNLKLVIKNYLGKEINHSVKNVLVRAQNFVDFSIPVNTAERGFFDWDYTLSNSSGLKKNGKISYCVISDNRKVKSTRFGMNFHMERPLPEQVDTALDILAEIGVGSIRAWWDWANAEGKKGVFNWKSFDSQVDLCERHQLDIFPVILRMYGPKWTVPDRFQNPPDDLGLWDNFVKNMVSRYKGRIKYWEVWNEPDVSPVLKNKPDLYLEVLKRSSKLIKQEDPQAQVVGFCGSYPWFFDAMLKGEGVNDLDVISYHSYLYKYNPEVSLVKWLNKFHKDLELLTKGRKIAEWNTEVGIVNGHNGYIESEESRARSCGVLLRNYICSWSAGTSRMYWFSASMISLYSHSVFEYGYVPSPAMVTLNALCSFLSGAKFLREIKRDSGENFFGYIFKTKAGRYAAVMWYNGFPSEKKCIFPKGSNIEVYDLMGVREKLKNFTFSMTSSYPVYVLSDNRTSLENSIAQAKFECRNIEKAMNVHSGSVLPAKPSLGPFKLSSEGMLIDWNILGSFANPGGRGYDRGLDIDYLKPIGGEHSANINFDTSFKYVWPDEMKPYISELPKSDSVKVIEYHGASAADYYGDKLYIDMLKVLKPKKYTVGYAFCYIESDKDTDALLKIGSDDGCKVILNHKQVWRNKIYRKAVIDDDVIRIHLHKGINPLLIKISQDGGGWGFYLRLTDIADKALTGIKIWL